MNIVWHCDVRIITNIGAKRGNKVLPSSYQWIRGVSLPDVPIEELDEIHLSRMLREIGHKERKVRQEIIRAGTHAIVEVIRLKQTGLIIKYGTDKDTEAKES